MSPEMFVLRASQHFVAELQEEFGWWPLPFVVRLSGDVKFRIWFVILIIMYVPCRNRLRRLS